MTPMYIYPAQRTVAMAAFFINLIISNILFAQHDSSLFPIEENGKWGFINQQGKLVIKPIFKNVGEFSYGLAPARLKGRYGYIDRKGNYKIEPIFDSGTSFVNGFAFVHIDGKKFLIDTTGTIIFQRTYQDIVCADEPCTMQRFIVTTQHHGQGIIDLKNRVILDTIYHQIFPYSEGFAVISNGYYGNALINEQGDFIIPFGKYEEIESFTNSIAKVVISNNPYRYLGVIDTSGKLITSFTELRYELDYNNSSYRNGMLKIKIPKIDSLKFTIYNKEGLHTGVLNSEGKIIASDTIVSERFHVSEYFPSNPFYKREYALLNYQGNLIPLKIPYYHIGSFFQNRAFVKENLHGGPSYIMDREGNIINKEPFRQLYGEGFKDGIAVAEVREGVVAIDTMGNYIYSPREIDGDYVLRDSFLFFQEDIHDKQAKIRKTIWGFWDLHTDIFIPARFDAILFKNGFKNNLLYVMEDSIKGYVNRKGEYIWRARNKETSIEKVIDTEFMFRGGFGAASPYKVELAGFGGWGGSSNISKKLVKNKTIKPNNFYIEIREKEKDLYAEKYEGFAFYIINTTSDTVIFDAQDSWLYMTMQAIDEKGNWRPIQYIPGSWCGNSYHQVFLAKDEYWKFTMPQISGAQKTKLRLALRYKDPKTQADKYVYSNEIKGSINPSQFWKKQEYSPSNLMDPYDE